jgi:hypothetical protein
LFFNYFYSEADLILYNKIKKFFTDNFNRISNKIKEEFKGKAQGAISSLSRTKSTRTYTLNTKTITTTKTTTTTPPKALSRTKSSSTYKVDTKTEKTEKKSNVAGTGGVDKKPAKNEKKNPNKNKGDSEMSGQTKKTATL